MPLDTICKTVRQHNREPISEENMRKLTELADDYVKVKNHVYQRYGGVGSLSKLYPGYTVQNEMTASGLRERLDMPSVYFYLAVFDALGDIKSQWSQTKKRILQAIKENRNLTPEEAHYLRFVLKVNNCMSAILNYGEVSLPRDLQLKFEMLAEQTDTRKADNYLRRQARKHLKKLHADGAEGFSIAERAYRYADHGIYISVKEKRKRVFIPLTDNNRYTRQLYVKLLRESCGVEILVPIDVHVQMHNDFQNMVGISVGMFVMMTVDSGRRYGENLGDYVIEKAEWIQRQTSIYQKNKKDNPGRKKYSEQKRKMDAKLYAYINGELNRFIREEKPRVICLPKLPAHSRAGSVKKYNHNITIWQNGYLRRRLNQKCREQSIELVEVFGKDISNECSECGNIGKKEKGIFSCEVCGFHIEEKVNAARNAKKRGVAMTDGGFGSVKS